MNSACWWARTSPSLARSYILVFACWEQFRYIPPTRVLLGWMASPPEIWPMVCADLTEPLDAFGNAAHRLFWGERVDLGLSARNIEVGQDQDIMQCNAVTTVCHWRI